MKGELRNRRRQFWAILLAIVMVVGLMPYGGVKADPQNYTFTGEGNTAGLVAGTSIICAGDTLKKTYGDNVEIIYEDAANAGFFPDNLIKDVGSAVFTEAFGYKMLSYDEAVTANGTVVAPVSLQVNNHTSSKWKIKTLETFSGNVTKIVLSAIPNYSVNFYANGGTFPDGSGTYTDYYALGDADFKVSEKKGEVKRIGYEFAGWYSGKDNADVELIPNVITSTSATIEADLVEWDKADTRTGNPTADGIAVANYEIKAHAKWTAKTYNVIYNVNANGPVPSQDAIASDNGKVYGVDSVDLAVLTDNNNDYDFLGWSKNPAATTQDFTGNTLLTALVDGTETAVDPTTGNTIVTLYGVWKAKPQYSLNYDKGSATSGSAPATETKSAGKTTQIAGNTGSLSKVGYKLVKWNTVADGSGTDYQFGATFTFAENPGSITLYPVWEGKKYNIKFKVNAKGPNPSQSDVNDENGKVYGTDSVNLISLTDQNNEYEFLGWSPDSTGNTGLLGDTSLVNFINGSENLDATTGNYEVTLYGIWKAKNKYTLTYDKGDAVSGTVPDAVTKAIGNTSVISGNTGNLVKAAGYHLEKWNTKADATGADYGFGTTFTFSDAAGNVTLYPVWKINAYSVSFDKNAAEASGSMTNQNFEYGTAQILTANAFTRDGYTFAGWSTTATGAVEYTDGQSVNNLTDSQDGIVTLYAVWTQSNTGNGGESGNGGGGTVPSPTPDPTPIITSEPVVSTTPTPTPETTPTPTVTPSVTPTPTPEVTPTPGAIVTPAPAQETKFSTVLARLAKIKKTSITVKWKKQKDVDGYEVYGVKCNAKGMKNKHILLATLGPDANSFKAKNLEKNTYYKFYVDAYKYIDREKVIVSRSAYLHGTTLSKKYGMASGVKLYVVDEEGNKTEVTGGHVSMKLGDVMQLLGIEQNDSGKKIKHHRGVRYEAKIEEIADVNYKKGFVEATQVGTTEIYAFAQNGVFAKIVLEVYDEE